MAASVTPGRALRYAGGSARGLLHHHPGHGRDEHGVTLTAGSVSIELAGLEESDLSSDMFLF